MKLKTDLTRRRIVDGHRHRWQTARRKVRRNMEAFRYDTRTERMVAGDRHRRWESCEGARPVMLQEGCLPMNDLADPLHHPARLQHHRLVAEADAEHRHTAAGKCEKWNCASCIFRMPGSR